MAMTPAATRRRGPLLALLSLTIALQGDAYVVPPSTSRSAFRSANSLSQIRAHEHEQSLPGVTDSIRQALAAAFLSAALVMSPLSMPQSATAADYGSLTDEQKAVAEAWRLVDNSYLERTFNNQDWFGMRQDAVKKKYKTMDEANAEIQKIVGSLGDKYTRYLPPAKYQSMVDSATGTLASRLVSAAMS